MPVFQTRELRHRKIKYSDQITHLESTEPKLKLKPSVGCLWERETDWLKDRSEMGDISFMLLCIFGVLNYINAICIICAH